MRYLWASFAVPFEVYMECPVDITFEITPGKRVRVRLRPPAPGDAPVSVVDEEASTWRGMGQKDIVTPAHFTHAEVWFAPPWRPDRLGEDGPDGEDAASLKAMLREGPEYALSIVNHLLQVAAHASRQFQIKPLAKDDVRDWLTGEANELGGEPHATGLMFTEPKSVRPRVCRSLNDVLPQIVRALAAHHDVPVWRKVLANAEWLGELGQYDAAIVVAHVALELRLNEVLMRLSAKHGSRLKDIVDGLLKGGVPKPENDDLSALETLRGLAAHGGRARLAPTRSGASQAATWADVKRYLETALRVAEYYEAACPRGD